MKNTKLKATFLLLFIFTSSLFLGWTGNYRSASITNFYYYKDAPFYLTQKPDMVFIKISGTTTAREFQDIMSEFTHVTDVSGFKISDKRDFVSLTSSLSDNSMQELISELVSKPGIEYASPVFSPDNGKTLIGVENEIIVQFKPFTSENLINSFIAGKNLSIVKQLELTGGLSYILQVPRNVAAINAANEVYNSGLVNWSEPNLLFTNLLCFDPNDTFYPMQWAQKNLSTNIPGGITGTADCDMDVDSAWNITLGISQCKIAISDTGVDTLHEDLASNMVLGSGYDFWNNDPYAWDDGNHGTACAGIVAAIGNNSTGISGVAPNCKLIPVKWLSGSGNGNYTGAVNATNWAYTHGAWVISNSWGFVGGASSALDQAITDAANLGRNGKGTLFVVASGNENGTMRYPANTHPRVLVIGGISPCNQRKSTTSCDLENFWGASYGSNLDVVAPCVKIYTTDRTGSVGYSSTNYFATFNGTSSATPNAAGVCALVLSKDSSLTWDSVRIKIDRTAEKRGTYSYTSIGKFSSLGSVWNNEMGYGLINARLVLESLTPTPPTPGNFNRYLLLPTPASNTNYVSIPHQSSMIGFTNMTIEAWVRYSALTNGSVILNKGSASYDYQLSIAANGAITFRIGNLIATGSQVTTGVWTHVAVTFDGTNARFYKNGLFISTAPLAGVPGSSANEMRIGRGGNDPGQGFIEELRIWTIARTQGQIDSNKCKKWRNTLTSQTGLKALWHLDSTYTDSVSGYNGTPQSAGTGFDTISFPLPGVNCNLVGIQNIGTTIPENYGLEQNYPNPFNPATNIKFSIPTGEFVEIKIFDITGRETALVLSEPLEAGYYSVDFNAANLASGVYFYKITAGNYSNVKKMVLIK